MVKKKKLSFKNILFSKILLYFLIILLIFIITPLFRQVNQRIRFRNELNRTKQQVFELEQQNQEFSQEIQEMQTDFFKEKQARLRFGLQKPGERVIIVVQNDNLESVKQDLKNKYFTKKFFNFKSWFNYFFQN